MRRTQYASDDAFAGETTFLTALADAERADEVRLLKSKGAFKTCVICNVLNNMLSEKRKCYTACSCCI